MDNNEGLRKHLSPLGAWAFAIGTSVGWGSLVVTANTYLAQAGPLGSIIGLALGALLMALIARQMRSDMLEVLRQDYITTARSKGLSERRVIYRHALKNAIIPVIMVIGGVFGSSLGGSLITEVIFSIPGLGQYIMSGLNNRDYPVIQSGILIISTMFAVIILLVDVVFALVDPRIRSQYTRRKRSKGGKNDDEDSKEAQKANASA